MQELVAACVKIRARRPELPHPQDLVTAFDSDTTIWADEVLRRRELKLDTNSLGEELMNV
jgi:hypothetical protein